MTEYNGLKIIIQEMGHYRDILKQKAAELAILSRSMWCWFWMNLAVLAVAGRRVFWEKFGLLSCEEL